MRIGTITPIYNKNRGMCGEYYKLTEADIRHEFENSKTTKLW